MKNLILFFFLLAITNINAQSSLPLNDQNMVEYSEVITLDKSKDEIYSSINEWFVKTFKDSKEVIDFQDKEVGKIVGKGIMVMDTKLNPLYKYDLHTKFVIKTEVKEGKYRFVISDFNITDNNLYNVTLEEIVLNTKKKNGKPKKLNVSLRDEFTLKMEALITSLKGHVAKADDW